jgi:hypothetical protein
MPFETRAADGGLFRVINGRRVWIANPPNSFIHEELTGPGYLPQPMGGQARVQDVLRLLGERGNAVPIKHD